MLDADTLPVVEKATRPIAGKKKAKRMKHTNDKSDVLHITLSLLIYTLSISLVFSISFDKNFRFPIL